MHWTHNRPYMPDEWYWYRDKSMGVAEPVFVRYAGTSDTEAVLIAEGKGVVNRLIDAEWSSEPIAEPEKLDA